MDRPNPAVVKVLRERRGWSQEQLGQIAELSVRTIQRVESTGAASLETMKSLAAAFEVEIATLCDANDADVEFLVRIMTGSALFRFVGGVEAFEFDNDELKSDVEVAYVGAFLQDLQDWNDIWDNIGATEQVRVIHRYTERIQELEGLGLWVFALRHKRQLGDAPNAISLDVGAVFIRRSDNATIIRVNLTDATETGAE